MKVGYVRISTAEQNTARQDEIMRQLGVEKVYTDKLSGKDTARPGLQSMMDFVREGDSVTVVTAPSPKLLSGDFCRLRTASFMCPFTDDAQTTSTNNELWLI